MRLSRCLIALFLAVISFFAAPHDAWSHGDEPHDEPVVAAPTTAGPTGIVRSATTEQFELVVKMELPKPGGETPVHLYLSDYATNTPVSRARFAIEWGDNLMSEARPSGQAGTYETTVRFPEVGSYSPMVNIAADSNSDLLPLDPIEVTAPAGETAKTVVWQFWLWPAIAGLIVLVLAGFALRRKRTPAAMQELENRS